MPIKPDQMAAAIRSGVNQKIADGNNLYLVVRSGRGFWVLQYRDGQKIRSKGLGSALKVSPAQARRAREAFVVGRRQMKAAGGRDRIAIGTLASANLPAPNSAPSVGRITAGSTLLFGDAVEEFIIQRARLKGWRGGISGAEADSYRRTLIRTSLAEVPIHSITTADVVSVLNSMPAATAEKTRARVVCVLKWAKAMGYRESTEHIARRRGHLQYLVSAVPRAKHHSASHGQRCRC